VPTVIATAQNEVRGAAAKGGAVYTAQADPPGAYTIDVPPGTYLVQCYVEHQGERYFGDGLAGVAVEAGEVTDDQDLTAPSVITADTYTSDGDTIGGWDWLRDTPYAHSSTWTFTGIDRSRNIMGHFMMLVTNAPNGGSGYDTTVQLTYTGAVGPTTGDLYLPPSGSPPDPTYPPDPEGYTTYATQSVNQNYVTTVGALTIKVKRINAENVGTRSASIWLVNY
jgi:hypothetical protein